MRIIYPGVVLVEEGDTDLVISQWLLEHTMCPYTQFSTEAWYKTPMPGYLIILGEQPYAILKWAYQYTEKKVERTDEEKFGMLQAILYDTFGDGAKHIIARLAREADRGDMHNLEKFYSEVDITQAETLPEHPTPAIWKGQDAASEK